ncbi:outer membrane protein assembly factor BamA [Candidatus Thiosymbion oneisti]|uniref:outer membrane protein assembly factor BamA n=1 Tax=Candidatus Thiosymbion oneisti TaxID=589554 RepID=UPI000A61FED2|nr:outer membrane protein assembly factor BamA [Candidatus Thiosymbion oneisti]
MLFIALLAVTTSVLAARFRISDIRVEGLQRIAAGTVFNYLPVQVGDTTTDAVTAGIIRALYATGFFKDVRVERDGTVLVVWVQERPAIAEINISGNRSIDTKGLKEGLKDIGLAEGRTFDRSLLDRIERELERQYYALGRYGVEIQSTVSPLQRNRVAVSIDIAEGLTARIKQINIIGNEDFEERELLDLFKLSRTRWYSFYSKNDQYSKQKLSGDLETLRSFYLDRGYIKFEIKSTQVSISADKQDIYITIGIDEGDVYKVSDMKLAGEPSVPVKQLFPLIHMRRGDVFSRKVTIESAERISKKLGNEGYAFANVNTIPELDEETKQVAVTFFVDPGKRVYVRRVNTKGNTRTRDEVLRREVSQLEAAWFSSELVRQSRERLQRLGYFEEVNVETPAVPGSADQVDVNLSVVEKDSGNLLAGIGYSQSQGIIFNTSITQNNFLGTGKQVSFAFNNSRSNRNYRLAYTNPYYTIDGISRGFELSYRETDYEKLNSIDYFTDVGVAGMNFGLPITDTSRAGLGIRYQYTKFTAGNSLLAQTFETDYGNQFNDFLLTASYTNDSRDRAIFPTKGNFQSLRAEVSVPGSDLQFFRLTYTHRRYIPLIRHFVLSLDADLGYGNGFGSTKDLPFFEHFFAGGPGSVRGWKENTLGPRETTLEENPAGGNVKMVGSIKLFAPSPVEGEFAKTLRLGAFFDFGNVWTTSNPTLSDQELLTPRGFSLSDIRYSAGLSLTWMSPVGALSASIARPFNDKVEDKTQMFQFSVGQRF